MLGAGTGCALPHFWDFCLVPGPQARIKTLGAAVANSEEATQAQQMFEFIEADIKAFRLQRWQEWCSLVSQTSEGQLKKPLVV